MAFSAAVALPVATVIMAVALKPYGRAIENIKAAEAAAAP